MRTKERNFQVELKEISDTEWYVIVSRKKNSKKVAHIYKRDDQHFDVDPIFDENLPKMTAVSLEKALNSALMQFNLHLH